MFECVSNRDTNFIPFQESYSSKKMFGFIIKIVAPSPILRVLGLPCSLKATYLMAWDLFRTQFHFHRLGAELDSADYVLHTQPSRRSRNSVGKTKQFNIELKHRSKAFLVSPLYQSESLMVSHNKAKMKARWKSNFRYRTFLWFVQAVASSGLQCWPELSFTQMF